MEKKKTEEVKTEVIESAFIVNKKLAVDIINAMLELPIKYSNLISPLIEELRKCPRGNITINK